MANAIQRNCRRRSGAGADPTRRSGRAERPAGAEREPPSRDQAWESFDALDAWARDHHLPHRKPWQRYLREALHDEAVGLWHETYLASPGGWEGVYLNMAPWGLAAGWRRSRCRRPRARRGRPLSGGMKTMMKFAISYNTAYYGVDPDKIVAYAQHAEACGFEALYLPEHIVLYPGARVGSTEIPPSLPIADPLDCLSFVAAATRRILLGTAVLLLPYHHPVVLAKRLATIDVLSKGRMRLLTVGVGTLPGEARAVGVAFGTRGRRADEAIDVLRLLWAGGEDGVSFEGEFFAFDNLCSFPKPYGVTHLPIHIGGSSRAAARRAGRRGDGYFPGGALSPQERALQLDLARSTAVEVGRDPEALEYTRWGSIGMPIERVEAFAAQGVTRIVVAATATDPAEQREELSAFAQRFGLLDRLT